MTLSELPDIQISKNIRAKRLRLRIDETSIRLTAPWFCTNAQIQNFIQDSEAWILKTWQAQQSRIQSIDRSLPSELQLFNLSQPLQIQYIQQKNNYLLSTETQVLLISNRQPERYLKDFVIDYAKKYLPPYLDEISTLCDLPYQACNIRQPKTRWGSCSAKHDIMLNSGIILFEKSIVKYLCVHELAHTKHFNHSTKFWAEVAKYDPLFKTHRYILKTTQMPYWW